MAPGLIEPTSANCVFVQLYDGRFWNVAFEPETGSAMRCHPTLDYHDFVGVHAGEDCFGPLHGTFKGTASLTIVGGCEGAAALRGTLGGKALERERLEVHVVDRRRAQVLHPGDRGARIPQT